ncbi:Ger(x)C family spore germination protein [Bacillus alkalisoli]|uniref:Ger(x)C family spore germination protein n=1 Tax=Bacillus alkalisoli TaxID=2011008 RepID=UPI000C2504EA|nr:Ger(x)C family spore germination protein [Bacillus alkalisoli]
MKQLHKTITILTVLILLTGCWDERLLKEATLLMLVGVDYLEDGQVQTSVSAPLLPSQETVDNRLNAVAVGQSFNETKLALDRSIPGHIEISKLKVFLLGPSVAQTDVYPFLDSMYRDPLSALNAKIAVVDGTAKDYIMLYPKNKPRISIYITELLNSAEEHSYVPVQTIEYICPIMFDEGQDFIVPYLKLDKASQEISVSGTALFNDKKQSGVLDAHESMLFLLLADQKGKSAKMTLTIDDPSNNRQPFDNIITIEIKKLDRKMKIVPKNDTIEAEIDLNLYVDVIEYPHDNLQEKKEVIKLDNVLTKILTTESEAVIKKLQEANCDGFGIGRRVFALHNTFWENHDWKELYPSISIKSNVHVKIIDRGIIN